MVGVLSPDLEELLVSTAGRLAIAAQPGAGVREVREHLQLTQGELATMLGIRRETLSRIEAGKAKPTVEMVDRLSRIATMSRAVRDQVAMGGRNPSTPNYLYFRMIGVSLRLAPELVDRVVQGAMEGYLRKRDAVLRTVGT